jgi:hypothetical protein
LARKESIEITSFKEGDSKVITKQNNQYILSEISDFNLACEKANIDNKIDISEMLKDYCLGMGVELSSFSFQGQNFFDFLGNEGYTTKSYGKVDLDTISNLAEDCQNNLEKIKQINSIISYYVNIDDLFGRVVETIENNTNKSYTIKDNIKTTTKIHNTMLEFCKQVDLPLIIGETAKNTFLEGTFIMYLLGNPKIGWHISFYPLGIVEVTDLEIDHEPVIIFKVDKLRNKIRSSLGKHLDEEQLKAMQEQMDLQVELNYPEEVYEAYMNNKSSVVLNAERTGIVRINRGRDGRYGVSPALKSLKSEIMLETIDNVDRKNLIDRAKKIYAQTMRKELLEDNDQLPNISSLAGLSQQMFNYAMQQEDVIYTAPPFVESINIIEPQVELTSVEKISEYRNRVLNALGIGFVTGEDGSSYTVTNLNYSELLKTINKMVKQLEPIFNKYFKVVARENKMPINKVPSLEIASSELVNLESKVSLINTYYTTLGLSRETTFKILDIDLETETKRRKEENDKGLNEIFEPYMTSYNSSSEDIHGKNQETNDTNSNGSKKSEDKDKAIKDKERNTEKSKTINTKTVSELKGGEIDG